MSQKYSWIKVNVFFYILFSSDDWLDSFPNLKNIRIRNSSKYLFFDIRLYFQKRWRRHSYSFVRKLKSIRMWLIPRICYIYKKIMQYLDKIVYLSNIRCLNNSTY